LYPAINQLSNKSESSSLSPGGGGGISSGGGSDGAFLFDLLSVTFRTGMTSFFSFFCFFGLFLFVEAKFLSETEKKEAHTEFEKIGIIVSFSYVVFK